MDICRETLTQQRANRLVVREDIPFREAYRRVAAELHAKKPSNS